MFHEIFDGFSDLLSNRRRLPTATLIDVPTQRLECSQKTATKCHGPSEISLDRLQFFVHQLRALMVFIQQSRVVPHDQPTHKRDQRHQETVSVGRGTHIHAPPEDQARHFPAPNPEPCHDRYSAKVDNHSGNRDPQHFVPVVQNFSWPVGRHNSQPTRSVVDTSFRVWIKPKPIIEIRRDQANDCISEGAVKHWKTKRVPKKIRRGSIHHHQHDSECCQCISRQPSTNRTPKNHPQNQTWKNSYC